MDGRATVLVADDDADQRELLVELLGGEGYALTGVGSPGALLAALESPPDVLLLDLHGASSPEVEAKLGMLGTGRPALVLASGAADIREQAERLRADAVLQKPFGLEELLSTLRALVPARTGPHPV
jgi:two-component system phosphate regulon response regulator OmpR